MNRFLIIVLLICIISTTLSFVFFFIKSDFDQAQWGVDLEIFYENIQIYFEKGEFERYQFRNFPLTSVLIMPYTFVSLETAKLLKGFVSLCLVLLSIFFLVRIHPLRFDNDKRELLLLILVCFGIFIQLITLNIYIEAAFCLILSLFLFVRGYGILSGAILALAIMIKIILLPMIIVPFILREFRVGLSALGTGALLFAASLAIFGVEIHIDMYYVVTEIYDAIRESMIQSPPMEMVYAGFSDLVRKMEFVQWISPNDSNVINLGFVLYFYGIALVILIFIWRYTNRLYQKNEQRVEHYKLVFATGIILSIGFNFRTDMLVLIMPFFPLLAYTASQKVNPLLVLGVVFLIINKLLIGAPFLYYIDLYNHNGIPSNLYYVFSFPLLGMNLLILGLLIFWGKREVKDMTEASENAAIVISP